MRQGLLKMMYDLSVLELELEQYRDSLHECCSAHSIVCVRFNIEEKEFQIRRLKYDIEYRKSLLKIESADPPQVK